MELPRCWVKIRSRLATSSQLAQVPKISPMAIQAALMPARYAYPGSPMSIQPLMSEASALMEVTQGPSARPPRAYPSMSSFFL